MQIITDRKIDIFTATSRDWPGAGTYSIIPGKESEPQMVSSLEAWVFGGMGSWIDLGFRDQAENNECEELSRQLYAAINTCTERSVDSFRAPQH